MSARCITDNLKNVVGEGPLWDPEEGCFYWTDINGFTIQRLVIDNDAVTTWQFAEPVCALSLTTDPEWLLVTLGSRLVLWHPATDERRDFARPEPSGLTTA